MFISMAYAQEAAATAAPDGAAFAFSNIGLILIMVLMFYFLLIRPQQKRFKEHKAMLDALQKGDRVVTAGGLVGVIDALPAEGSDEVVVDLGNGLKVTALRHTIQAKADK
jgi:preprotein translocase subunit YajC